MRKTALLLSLLMLLSACNGGGGTPVAESSPPVAAEMGRDDLTLPPESPAESGPAPSGEGGDLAESDPISSELPENPDVSASPTASPAGETPASPDPSPGSEETGGDSTGNGADPSDGGENGENSVPAGMVAGEDYNFSQPVPETAAVSEDYFADAVMIGDSRIEGFRLFSGLTQGEFISHTGLMIFKVFDAQITFHGEKMTVPEALEKGKYRKVYISLGVNELGMYNDQGYHDNFAKFVDKVREIQPEATIYIQLLIPVNTQKCEEKEQPYYVTNEQIGVYNDILRQVAQEKEVFLVDPAQAIVDETGEPPYDLTSDGVHFQPTGYRLWYDYLTKHTIDKGDHP